MSGQQVFPPFQVFTDEDGDPLENGYLYIGQENLNPQVAPIEVFWDPELTILAAQPIRTLGGYPSRNGTPSRFFVKELIYSITVKNKKGELVFTLLDAQNSLGNMLGDDDVDAGAALIARGDQMVNTVAELRLLNKHSASQYAYVHGYYAAGDGGGGEYYLDALDLVTPDNGGSIIVAADGARWKLATLDSYSVRQFGAKGDQSTDDTAAMQACIDAARNANKSIYLPTGRYLTSSSLFIDNSASTSYLDQKKMDVYGDGTNLSRIVYVGTTGSCLSIVGGTTAGTLPQMCMQELRNFTVIGTNAVLTSGIFLDTTQEVTLSNVQINSFDFGLNLIDVDFLSLYSCQIQFNNHGVMAQERAPRQTNSTRPNAINFYGCKLGGNGIYGGLFLGGSCVNFYGGHIEGNGQNNGASGWGVRFESSGVQGGVGANLNGVYFEKNQGVADVWMVALDPPAVGLNPYHCVQIVQSCSFNRVDMANITTHNVVASYASANSGKQKLVVRDSSFKGYGGYVPDAGRSYIFFASDVRNASNALIEGNIQQDDLETVPQNDFYNVSLNLSGAQSITSAVATDINWTGELYDGDAMHAANSNLITAPVAGKYVITASVYWQASGSGTRTIQVFKNGATEIAGDTRNAASSGKSRQSVSREVLLAKGDTISLRCQQDSGGNLTADTDGTFITVRSLPY